VYGRGGALGKLVGNGKTGIEEHGGTRAVELGRRRMRGGSWSEEHGGNEKRDKDSVGGLGVRVGGGRTGSAS
jgi:hypothetical protein